MTLLSRSHAVLGLRNSGMSRATKETSFSSSSFSSWESDDANDNAVWNMLVRNSGMSWATKEMSFSSSSFSFWESDDANDNAVWNMLDNGVVLVEVAVEVADNDAMSNINVIGMES